jgi:hypothetical protein
VDAVSLSAVPAHGDYAFYVFGVSTNGSLWRYIKDKNIGESVTETPDGPVSERRRPEGVLAGPLAGCAWVQRRPKIVSWYWQRKQTS